MLELRTLGTIDLQRVDGQHAESVSLPPKALSLLAYLCAGHPPRPHRRDTLVALLWPELDDTHARGALRQELYQLRRALGPDVIVSDGEEAVGVDSRRLWCDASAFEAALQAGHLADALRLWRGEFLPGLHVDGGEYERWVDETRDRLLRRATEVARVLSRDAEVAGDHAAAIAAARRLTELAPCDETAWRDLISLLDHTGDRAGALSTYETMRARLREDLEVEPSPETVALVDKIRERAEAFAAAMPGTDRPAVQQLSRARASDQPVRAHAKSARSGRRRWYWIAIGTMVTGAAAVTLFAPGQWVKPPAAWTAATISLLRTDNQTGDTTFNTLGRRVTDRLAQGLIEPPFVQLVMDERARNARALVSTTLYRHGDTVEVRARLVEAKGEHRVLAVPQPVFIRPGASDDALDTLTARMLAAVAMHYDPRTVANRAGAPFQTPSWQAYLEYIQGAEFFGERRFDDAARHLRKAHEIDPGFAKAAIFAGIALAYDLQPEVADSLTSAAMKGALADYERLLGDWLLGSLHGNRSEAYRAANGLTRISKHPVLMFIGAREALAVNRPREALRYFRAVEDIGHGWWRNWTEIWEKICGALHRIGDHQGELAAARAARTQFPQALDLIRAEIRAQAALGASDRVTALVAEALTLPPTRSVTYPLGDLTPADVAWTAAQELDVHGHPAVGARVRGLALGWLRAREAATPPDKLLEARLLLESGDAVAARRVVATLAPFNDLEALGVAGLVAAALGDTAAARNAIATLEGLANPYLSGHHLLLAAGIYGALHQPAVGVQTLRAAFAAGLPFGEDLHALPILSPLAGRKDFSALMRPRD